ncbi:MAG: NAD-binding protein [Actinomycetota bacterium]|nr:NAD-binding protein [Actinomycetota bacterium]
MRKITLADRLRYRFDNTISRGTVALIAWLFVLLVALVFASSLVVYATGIGGERLGFLEILWLSLMRTIDPGGVGGDRGSWPFLLSMLAVTTGGILVFSTLIGIIFTGIDNKLDELRKGRSFVVEKGHTVVYGWSPEVFSVVSELAAANESRRSACVAVLAEKDKVEMEDEIRDRVGKTKNTRVVCRTGDPIDIDDLELVNPHEARAIIILPPEGEDADSRVIKTVLALTNNPNRREEAYHIVSRMREPENLGVARMVGGAEVELVPVDDLIARITAQTCRQSGLSVVYNDLLDFGGDEIYFAREPSLVGKTFGEALAAYESCSVIGLRTGEGRIRLNPSAETEVTSEDALILIAEDDSAIALSENIDPEIDAGAIRKPQPPNERPERTLILGWNDRAPTMLAQLDRYVPPGSEVTVVAPEGAGLTTWFDEPAHQTVSFHTGNTTDRRTLDALGVPSYDHVIVLSYPDGSGGDADSKTLVSLLHLREIAEQSDQSFSIVSEMLDDRNRELAEIARADDFIVSDRLVSLMMCQVSENKEYAAVFEELIDPEGSELYLKPADEYVEPGVPLSFYTVLEAARRRGEVAVGYRVKTEAGDPRKSYGVHLNPVKSRRITLAEDDRVIVLAES